MLNCLKIENSYIEQCPKALELLPDKVTFEDIRLIIYLQGMNFSSNLD